MPPRRSGRICQIASKSNHDKLIAYPTEDAPDRIVLTFGDLRRLKAKDGTVEIDSSAKLLNDQLVDFYIRHLQRKVLTESQQCRVHIFNSFFLKSLKTTLQKRRAARARARPPAAARLPRHACMPSSLAIPFAARSAKGDSCDKILRWNGLKDINLLEKELIFVPARRPAPCPFAPPRGPAHPRPARPAPRSLLPCVCLAQVHEKERMGGHWALAVVCFPALAIQPPPHAPEAAQVRRPLRRATSRPAPLPLPTRAAVASAASSAAASSDAASSDTASLPPLARSDAPASSLHRRSL